MGYLKDIFTEAQIESCSHTMKLVGDDFMVLPCGFAWVYLKTRKNSKIGKELVNEKLMEWNPIHKRYEWWVDMYNQSHEHKLAHAKKLSELLSEQLYLNFDYESKLD